MTPALSPNTGSLFTLQGALFELLEERDSIARDVAALEGSVDQPARMAELDAINTGIACFVRDKLTTVDDLRAPLKAMEHAAAICKADAQQSMNQAAMWQNRYDRLKDLIKLAMEQLEAAGQWKPKETKKFESARGSFTLRGNGGTQPVEITDESMVPDEYCRVTVTMPFRMAAHLIGLARDVAAVNGNPASMLNDIAAMKMGPREVSRSAVAEALAKPCGNCDGSGKKVCLHILETEDDMNCPDCDDDGYSGPCDECGGSGRTGVPGARLAARGTALVVK